MDHKMSFRMLHICGVCSLVTLLLSEVLSRDRDLLGAARVLLVLGIGMVLAAWIQAFFFYRCPCCGSLLSFRCWRPVRCPRCKKRIDW